MDWLLKSLNVVLASKSLQLGEINLLYILVECEKSILVLAIQHLGHSPSFTEATHV